jgi:hypothetical protein
VKTIFAGSVAVSSVASFYLVKAYRKHEQKKFDRKMNAVDSWLDRTK